MKKSQATLLIIFTATLFFPSSLKAQDSTIVLPDDYKRNVIKWNITPFLLWSNRNINLSYERVLSPNRSFSVNAGYFELPSTGSFDSLNISNTRKKAGFSISGDYRFYFKNRNTNFAPDGLYWGVYGSYHHYQFRNDLEVINSPDVQGMLELNGKLNIVSLGVELGYQFVIKERFTIDLIFMGPSLSMYNTNMTLDGNLTVDGKEEYLKAIYDILVAKYPGMEELIRDREYDGKSAKTSMGFGLRYMIQLGYRF
jgi:hypothetical protein